MEVNSVTVRAQVCNHNHLQWCCSPTEYNQSVSSLVTQAYTTEAMSAEHREFDKHCLGQSVQDTGGVYVSNEGQVKSQYGLIFKRHLCQPSMGIGHNDK